MSGKITNTFSTTVILSNKWDLTHVTSFQSTTTLCQYSTLIGGSVALLVQPRPLLSEPVPGKFHKTSGFGNPPSWGTKKKYEFVYPTRNF